MGNTCLNSEQATQELTKIILPQKQPSQIALQSHFHQQTSLNILGIVKYQLDSKAETVFDEAKGLLFGDRLVLTTANNMADFQHGCKNIWFLLNLYGSQGIKAEKVKVIKYKIFPYYIKSKNTKTEYAIGVLDRTITLQNYLPLQRVDRAILNQLSSQENHHFSSFPTSVSYECILKEKDINVREKQTQINKARLKQIGRIHAKSSQNLEVNCQRNENAQSNGCFFNEEFINTVNNWISQFKQIKSGDFSIQHASSTNLKSSQHISSIKRIQESFDSIKPTAQSKIQRFWRSLEQSQSEAANTKAPDLYKLFCIQKGKKQLSRSLIDLLTKIGQYFRNNQDFEDSLQFYQRSVEVWEFLKLQKDKQYAEILFWMGVNQGEMGNHDQAFKAFTEQLKILDRCGEYGSKMYTSSVNNIGYINCIQGKYQDSIKMFTQAVSLREKLVIGKDSLVAGYINNLGSAYFYNHDYDIAKCKILSALQMWKELGETQTLEVAMAHYRLAIIYFQQRMFQKTLQLIHNSIKIGKKHRQTFKLAEKLIEFKILVNKISVQYCLSQEAKKMVKTIISDYYRSDEVQQIKKIIQKGKN